MAKELRSELEVTVLEAIGVLREVMAMNPISDPDLARARIARSALGGAGTIMQTLGAQEAFRYSMARDVLDDPAQRAEYLRISIPGHGALKVLGEGKRDGTQKS